jgi:hypothetical protein
MDVCDALRDRILSLVNVTTLVGSRVYTHLLPQRVTLPAVRLQRISETEAMQQRGVGGIVRARVQVDSVSRTRDQAIAIDEALFGDGAGSGMAGWRGDIGSPPFHVNGIYPAMVREVFDGEELAQFRVMRDYWVFFGR